MSNSPRNIVIIKTDHQRHDTINALGYPHMITPHMDRLVKEGVSFTNAYCCGATCISSRAAFYTGMFAHNTGCYSFDQWSHNPTWLGGIKDAGYHTAAIGKVHHSPATSMMAFDDRVYSENFPEMKGWHDDYANFLKANDQESGCKLITQDGRWLDKCCSDVFPLGEQYHVDQFVGRMATRWIRDYEKSAPFFLHVGFVGPHDPFDPPQRFLDMYDDRDVPAPHVDSEGLGTKPGQYKRHMESCLNSRGWERPPGHGSWAVDLRGKSVEELKRMRRHYYAELTQIDEQIGHIIGMLEERELLDDTLIILTCDHGDNLGDHGLMYKWLMTDQAVRVPMVIRMPGSERVGEVDDGLFSQIDIGPTLLDLLDLPIPSRLDGSSNLRRIAEGDSSQTPETVYCEDNYLLMARTNDRKYIHYAGQPYGEYYDMDADPWEEENLIDHRPDEVGQLRSRLLDWLLVSRYHGSLPQVRKPDGERSIWPANHPEDPYVLHSGCIGNNAVKL
jgi:arylsulfatase